MGAQALPPPGAQPSGEGGGGMGAASPAPPTPDKGGAQMLDVVRGLITGARMIGMKVPAAAEDIRAIMDSLQKIQQKIVQQQGPAEPMAPPV